MKVRQITSSELDWANERYTEIDFVHSSSNDFIAVAEVNGIKAGLGRVVPVAPGIGELGGMYVLPEFRGHSLSGNIVDFLIQNSGFSTLYCIPFAHLESLYASHGFLLANQDSLVPDSVISKFKWCQNHYNNPVLLMIQHVQ